MQHYSPLRYPGGKGKVAEYFKHIFRDNLLCDGIYVEPYAGGASVGLSLLFNGYVSKIIINDIDRSIYAFWHSVLNQTDEFCNLIDKTPVTIGTWKKQKALQKNKMNADLLQLGFSTFFLNRTNRSGILNAGVIGGIKQKGKWKISARYNKRNLITRVQQIAAHKKRIELYNLDAVELIRKLKKTLPSKTLFYLDPPYYIKGKDLYLNFYNDEDHKRIAKEIKKVKNQKWVITYDCVQPIKQLYPSYTQSKYLLNYSAAKPNHGKEVMIFSDNLYVPRKKIIVSAAN